MYILHICLFTALWDFADFLWTTVSTRLNCCRGDRSWCHWSPSTCRSCSWCIWTSISFWWHWSCWTSTGINPTWRFITLFTCRSARRTWCFTTISSGWDIRSPRRCIRSPGWGIRFSISTRASWTFWFPAWTDSWWSRRWLFSLRFGWYRTILVPNNFIFRRCFKSVSFS